MNHHLNKQKYFSINIFVQTKKLRPFGYFEWKRKGKLIRVKDGNCKKKMLHNCKPPNTRALLESATHFFVCHLAYWPSTIDAVDAVVALGWHDDAVIGAMRGHRGHHLDSCAEYARLAVTPC